MTKLCIWRMVIIARPNIEENLQVTNLKSLVHDLDDLFNSSGVDIDSYILVFVYWRLGCLWQKSFPEGSLGSILVFCTVLWNIGFWMFYTMTIFMDSIKHYLDAENVYGICILFHICQRCHLISVLVHSSEIAFTFYIPRELADCNVHILN